jgi:error-prone DNA polymerase
MIQRADTVGVFQIESRAQMNMLPRLKPEKFYDLVIEVAIVRPGPIQGKMVHPYLRRRRGEEPVDYPHPKLEQILRRTLGVPLFQEQVMRLAEAIGGYTPGEADQLRRDMAAWRRSGKMERHRRKLMAGMLANGLSPEFAARIFEQIEGFGSYGFPESHAAAFAHLAYVTAYLKCHYPVEFAVALINSQPMGFYSPAVIVNDLKRHGGKVLRPDVRESCWDCTVVSNLSPSRGEGRGEGTHPRPPALRLGLRLIRSFNQQAAGRVVQARTSRPFSSIADLAQRASLDQRQLVSLAAAGALEGFGERRSAIWKAAAASGQSGDLFAGRPKAEPPAELPALSEAESLALDARYAATFPGRHPMELLRAQLDRRGILRARDLERAHPNSIVTVAGLVITRQRPESANGTVFMTLEDETGNADIAVSSECFRTFQAVARLSGALMIRGRLRADGRSRSINAQWLGPLREATAGIPSHDFH